MKFCFRMIVLTFATIIFGLTTFDLASADEIIYRPGPDLGKDTMLKQERPSENFGGRNIISALPTSTCNNTGGIILIQFDLDSLPDDVNEVYLGFTHVEQNACYLNCTLNYYFYPVMSPWNEATVTYNTRPYIDYNRILYGPVTLNAPHAETTQEYDITEIYRAWKNGTLTNYGLAIYSPDGGCNNAAASFGIYSSDDENESKRPYLRIVYPSNTLTVEASGGGTVTADGIECPGDCSAEYEEGTTVELTATAADGYGFSGWSGDCAPCGDDPTCTITMDGDKSCTASFLPITRQLNYFKIYWNSSDENGEDSSTVQRLVNNLYACAANEGMAVDDVSMEYNEDFETYFVPWTEIPFEVTGQNQDIEEGLTGEFGFFCEQIENAYVLNESVSCTRTRCARIITYLFGTVWWEEAEPPEIISFEGDPTSGLAPLTVTFTCGATDPDGTVVAYEWDFGDGSALATSNEGSITHTYSAPGTYQATCRAYDNDGASALSDPVTIEVEEEGPAWQDISEGVDVNRSRTLYDRINRCFWVHLDITNNTGVDLLGPVRMVLESSTIPLYEGGPGLDPDGYTEDGKPYFIIVPEGGSWQAGQVINDIRLDFERRRARLNYELRFEQLTGTNAFIGHRAKK